MRERHRSQDSAATITAAIREFFADAEASEAEWDHFVDAMPGNDPDDHRHMAAAIVGHAQSIVTWDRDNFPAGDLAAHGIEVIDPDSYLYRLLNKFPREVTDTVIRLTADKTRPPKTPQDLTADLHRAGLARFAERLSTQPAERH